MGKKYIVEIGRLERLYKAFVGAHRKPSLTWLSPEVDLTPYTEPDLEQVRKEGDEKGYRRALADVREEQVCQTCVYFEQDENEEPCVRCPRNFIDQYMPKQERDVEIKVGDEVIYNGTTTCVVFCPENDKRYASIIDADGVHYSADHRELTKTGRHFSEIAAVIEKMRGEQDG